MSKKLDIQKSSPFSFILAMSGATLVTTSGKLAFMFPFKIKGEHAYFTYDPEAEGMDRIGFPTPIKNDGSFAFSDTDNQNSVRMNGDFDTYQIYNRVMVEKGDPRILGIYEALRDDAPEEEETGEISEIEKELVKEIFKFAEELGFEVELEENIPNKPGDLFAAVEQVFRKYMSKETESRIERVSENTSYNPEQETISAFLALPKKQSSNMDLNEEAVEKIVSDPTNVELAKRLSKLSISEQIKINPEVAEIIRALPDEILEHVKDFVFVETESGFVAYNKNEL